MRVAFTSIINQFTYDFTVPCRLPFIPTMSLYNCRGEWEPGPLQSRGRSSDCQTPRVLIELRSWDAGPRAAPLSSKIQVITICHNTSLGCDLWLLWDSMTRGLKENSFHASWRIANIHDSKLKFLLPCTYIHNECRRPFHILISWVHLSTALT